MEDGMSRLLAVLFLLFIQSGLFAAESPLWGGLKPGPYGMGFQTAFEYDPARPYKRKLDYDGNLYKGERARPLQISFWYPAKASGNRMRFEDYVALTANEEKSGEASTSEKQQSMDRFLHSRWFEGVAAEKLQEVLKTEMAAVRNAPPADGRFPLVLVAHSVGMSFPYGNAVLCEYLASNGYVVVTSPGVGATSRQLSFDSIGVSAQMQDLQHLIRHMRGFPATDPNKLAVIGFSYGALASSLLAMHNADLDAMVSLDGSVANRFGYSVLFQNPLYRPSRFAIPLLHLTSQEPAPDSDTTFFRLLKYSDLYQIRFKGATPTDFSTIAMIHGSNYVYESVCLYTLRFLNGQIRKDPEAIAFLQRSDDGLARIEHRAALKTPPTEEQFVAILMEKGVEPARTIFREVKKNDPDFNVFDEDTLNGIAENLIAQKKNAQAIEILKLNAEANPDYWLIYDLMGRAHMSDGNKALAVESFKKSLELNPENTNAVEMLKTLQGA